MIYYVFYFCSWWMMVGHLGWSLLGLSGESDPLASVDDTSEHIARILYAAFIIFGVILLLNMLIALLSNTYQRTEVRDDMSTRPFTLVMSVCPPNTRRQLLFFVPLIRAYYERWFKVRTHHCTAPHRTAPHRTAPHRTAPHRTAPHRTAPHRTATCGLTLLLFRSVEKMLKTF